MTGGTEGCSRSRWKRNGSKGTDTLQGGIGVSSTRAHLQEEEEQVEAEEPVQQPVEVME